MPKVTINCSSVFGLHLFVRDFAIGPIAWSVYSQFDTFVFHRSNALFWAILLIVLGT
jgi:hypothetical protein